MAKFIEAGTTRVMDRAWMRDGKNVYTGEALVLACLLHVKKQRTAEQEEELKEIMEVYAPSKRKNPSRNKKNKK
jgi:hypothetical protein